MPTTDASVRGTRTVRCRACCGALAPWGVTGIVPLLKCDGCGSIHADCEKPSDDLYADLYSREDIVPAVVAASLDGIAASMRPFRTHGRWLDIGFGQGALLDAAARAGFECHGTELSQVALDKGRARGFVTARGTEGFPDRSFDVVSLVELVEHVEDPAGFLHEARRVLRPGGCLYITTPNAWSVNRFCLGGRWSVFAPPDHITIFTPRGLRRLLVESGFERVSIRAEGLNPFEILRRPSKEGEAMEFNRAQASTRLCESFSASPGRRRMKAALNALLSLGRVGDSLKVRAT